MKIIIINVKTLLVSSLPCVAHGRGLLQIEHGGFLVVMQSRSQVVMFLFSACANTPEVSFVENNEKERTIFLDSGLPQEGPSKKYHFSSDLAKTTWRPGDSDDDASRSETDLTNGRTANWTLEVAFSPSRALLRSQSFDDALSLLNLPNLFFIRRPIWQFMLHLFIRWRTCEEARYTPSKYNRIQTMIRFLLVPTTMNND